MYVPGRNQVHNYYEKFQETKSSKHKFDNNFVGSLIANTFSSRISTRIGSGQLGEVRKAVWSVSGTTKELAIKPH